jgi:hypothetical protein
MGDSHAPERGRLMLSATQPARFFWAVVMVALAVTPATGDGPIEETLKSVVLIRTPGGLGSGFIVKERSLVATNYHVIEGETEATAEFLDGTAIQVSGCVGLSAQHDLAVLRLAEDGPAVPLVLLEGRADLGTDVFALGSPKGLAGSVSKGSVGAYRRWREVAERLPNELGHFGYDPDGTWVQTDTAVIRGNSGGPLVTVTGEVVAMNTLASSVQAGQNMNFSVAGSHLDVMLDHLWPIPLQLSLLPKQKDARPAAGAAAMGQRTKEFWDAMTRILGTKEVEEQETAIRLGDFIPAIRDIKPALPPAESERLMRQLAYLGKTETRKRDPKHPPSAADLVALYPKQFGGLTPAQIASVDHELQGAARLAQRRIARADGNIFGQMADELRQKQEDIVRKEQSYLESDSQAAARAADAIDSLDSSGVDPTLVEHSVRLATRYRRLALTSRALKVAFSRADVTADLSQKWQAWKDCRSDVREYENVVCPELKVRLERSYEIELGPLFLVTPEQAKLFEGTWEKRR